MIHITLYWWLSEYSDYRWFGAYLSPDHLQSWWWLETESTWQECFDTQIWHSINSLYPKRYQSNFNCAILQVVVMVIILSIYSEVALKWIPDEFTDDKLTLVQVMAWCHQATSQYLSQYWPKSILKYGITQSHNSLTYWWNFLRALFNHLLYTRNTVGKVYFPSQDITNIKSLSFLSKLLIIHRKKAAS